MRGGERKGRGEQYLNRVSSGRENILLDQGETELQANDLRKKGAKT